MDLMAKRQNETKSRVMRAGFVAGCFLAIPHKAGTENAEGKADFRRGVMHGANTGQASATLSGRYSPRLTFEGHSTNDGNNFSGTVFSTPPIPLLWAVSTTTNSSSSKTIMNCPPAPRADLQSIVLSPTFMSCRHQKYP